MDNLNNIPNVGNWGDAASKLNDNFNKVKQAVTTVENASQNNKGYFTSLSALNTAFPSPKAGQTAYVYDEASSTNYYIYNAVNGAWVTASIEAPSIGVDIAGYTKTGGSSKTTKQVEDEIAQLAGETLYNVSKNNSNPISLSEAIQQVPQERRKINALVSYISDKGNTLAYYVATNPNNEEHWNNQDAWRIVYGGGSLTYYSAGVVNDRYAARGAIPYRNRIKGLLLNFQIGDTAYLAQYKGNTGDFLSEFNKDANWETILPIKQYDEPLKIVGETMSFTDAVNRVEVANRKKNTIVSYASDEGVKLIQYVSDSDPQNSTFWEDETGRWKTIQDNVIQPVVSVGSVADRYSARNSVKYWDRQFGQLLIYDVDGISYVQKYLSQDKSASEYIKDANWKTIVPDIESNNKVSRLKKDYTLLLKEQQKKTCDRNIINAEIGSISEELINVPTPHNSVIRFGLHNTDQQGTVRFDEVFFNGNVRPDFSDVRFTDRLDLPLEFTLHVSQGVDYIRNNSFGDKNLAGNGVIFKSAGRPGTDKGVYMSSDNGMTWTKIQEESSLIGLAKNGTLFSWRGTKYYRMTTPYVPDSEVEVLDIGNTIGNSESFAENSNGDLFVSKYQEDFWDAVIFKSTDNGITWSVAYRTSDKLHVHQIYIDDRDYIYAGLDGAWGDPVKGEVAIWSKDNGLTWQELSIPYANRDYGITYSGLDDKGERFALGNGEASIKGGYSIYKTKDFENFYPVMSTGQRVSKIVKFKGRLLAFGMASMSNRTAQIFESYDDGETWRTVYTENWVDERSSGAGMRYVSDVYIYDGVEQLIVSGTGGGADFLPIQVKSTDKSYAVAMVNCNNLSGIKVKKGFSIPFSECPNIVFNKNITDGLITDIRFDEGAGYYVEDYINNNLLELKGENDWINGLTTRYNSLHPSIARSNNGILFKNGGFITQEKTVSFFNGITIVFWLNQRGVNFERNQGFIWGDPDGMHLRMQGIDLIYLFNGSEQISWFSLAKWKGTDFWVRYCFVIDPVRGKSSFTDNDNYRTEFENNKVLGNIEKEYVGCAPGFNQCDRPIAGLKVYNRALNYSEQISDYLGFTPATI